MSDPPPVVSGEMRSMGGSKNVNGDIRTKEKMEYEIFDYPVNGTLDLHMFKPKDVKSALSEYLIQCRIQGILHVRIIHGKGHGVLRQIVHSFLESCAYVKEFNTPSDASGWGATIVILEPMEKNSDNSDH